MEGKNERRLPKIEFSYNAPVTLTFVLLCVAVLILNRITMGISTLTLFEVYRSPLTPLACFRMFGHVLGHADMAHLSGNLGMLLVLGPNLEERYGSRSLLLAILLTAGVSGLTHYIFFPGSKLLGASGVVFMMILLSAFGGARTGKIPLTLVFVFIFYLGGEVWSAISVRDSVSQLTHIVGGLCGTYTGYLFRLKPDDDD